MGTVRGPERPPLCAATQIPKATNAGEQALCTVRSCLSKLAPENFDKIAAKVVEVEIADAATLAQVVELMFERAIVETHFTEIYARLFAHCAMHLPSFDGEEACAGTGTGRTLTFRKLLLNKAQHEFEASEHAERKRKLGTTLFVGQLWLHGLLLERTVHGCVTSVLDDAEAARTLPLQSLGGGKCDVLPAPLQTECVEVACTLLRVIGAACDKVPASRVRMDAYMARLAGWLSDKSKLPPGRVRFKVMDLVDARSKGWKAAAKT